MRTKDHLDERRHGRATVQRQIHFDSATDRKMDEFLATYTSSRGRLSRSALVRKAVNRYLKQEDEYWSLLFTCFNKLSEKVDAYTRGMDLLKNILMHYISYYFLTWPEFSPEEKEDVSLKGMRIAAKFENSLKTKLEQGGYLQQLTPEAIRELIIENQKSLDLDQLHATAELDRQDRRRANARKDQNTAAEQP